MSSAENNPAASGSSGTSKKERIAQLTTITDPINETTPNPDWTPDIPLELKHIVYAGLHCDKKVLALDFPEASMIWESRLELNPTPNISALAVFKKENEDQFYKVALLTIFAYRYHRNFQVIEWMLFGNKERRVSPAGIPTTVQSKIRHLEVSVHWMFVHDPKAAIWLLEAFPSLRSIEFNFRINYEAIFRKFEGQVVIPDVDIDVADEEELLAQEDFLQKSYQRIDTFVATIAASKKDLSVKGFLVAEGYSFSMMPVGNTPLRRTEAEAFEYEHSLIDNYLLHYIERPGTTEPTGRSKLWKFHELTLSQKEVGEFDEERFQRTLRENLENLEIEAH